MILFYNLSIKSKKLKLQGNLGQYKGGSDRDYVIMVIYLWNLGGFLAMITIDYERGGGG